MTGNVHAMQQRQADDDGVDVFHADIVGDGEDVGGNADATLRNSTAIPDTRSARENHSALLSASRDAGYGHVGLATGRDKSWVCRYLQGEGVASLAEVLSWMDAAGLKIVTEDSASGHDSELLAMLIERLSDEIDAHDRNAERSANKITIDKGLYDALTLLAKRATVFMRERVK